MHINGCWIDMVFSIPHLEVSDVDSDTVSAEMERDELTVSELVADTSIELVAVPDEDMLSVVDMEEVVEADIDDMNVSEGLVVNDGVGCEMVGVGSEPDNVSVDVMLVVPMDPDVVTALDRDVVSDVVIGSETVWMSVRVGVGPGEAVTGRDIVLAKVHVGESVELSVCETDRVVVAACVAVLGRLWVKVGDSVVVTACVAVSGRL